MRQGNPKKKQLKPKFLVEIMSSARLRKYITNIRIHTQYIFICTLFNKLLIV